MAQEGGEYPHGCDEARCGAQVRRKRDVDRRESIAGNDREGKNPPYRMEEDLREALDTISIKNGFKLRLPDARRVHHVFLGRSRGS